MIAEQLEFSAEQRRWLKRAALLHDIGKLGVSNAILDKPGTQIDANCFAALSRALGRIDETPAA
jgi:response regulator RpfG family c-di-GMP phosphodiesterase